MVSVRSFSGTHKPLLLHSTLSLSPRKNPRLSYVPGRVHHIQERNIILTKETDPETFKPVKTKSRAAPANNDD